VGEWTGFEQGPSLMGGKFKKTTEVPMQQTQVAPQSIDTADN